MTGDVPRAIDWAETFAVYPSFSAADSTRSRKDSATRRSEPLSTREAVARETPASRATSCSVGAGPRAWRGDRVGDGRSADVAGLVMTQILLPDTCARRYGRRVDARLSARIRGLLPASVHPPRGGKRLVSEHLHARCGETAAANVSAVWRTTLSGSSAQISALKISTSMSRSYPVATTARVRVPKSITPSPV